MLHCSWICVILIGLLALKGVVAQNCNVTYLVFFGKECTEYTTDTITPTLSVPAECGADTALRVMERAADADSSYAFRVTYLGQPLTKNYVLNKMFGYASNGSCEWYVYRNSSQLAGTFYNRTVSTFVVNKGDILLLYYGIYMAPTAPPTASATTLFTTQPPNTTTRSGTVLSVPVNVAVVFAASLTLALLQF